MGEKPKKYHVTNDGDVFRINDDGSFTSMGNAEKMSEPNSDDSNESTNGQKPSKDEPAKPTIQQKSRKLFWICGIILLLIIGGGVALYLSNTPKIEEKSTESNKDIMLADVNSISHNDSSKVSQVIEDAPEKENTSIKPVDKKSESKQESKQESKPVSNKNSDNKISSDAVPNKTSKSPIRTDELPPIRRTKTDPNKVYYEIDERSHYPGGNSAQINWINNNVRRIKDENGEDISGTVTLDFVIERDGSTSSVKVVSSTDSRLNNEAIRLISSMRGWVPAKVDNESVRSPKRTTIFF